MLLYFVSTLNFFQVENMEIRSANKGGFIALDDIPNMKYTAKTHIVVVWLRSLHNDPDHYDDPLNFNPDRWDKPAKPGTYQVFGGGHMICAGNMLARLQLTIMLHHLSVGYK
ncbi:hypothetical protein PR202_ga26128 [Eleusine coracana subsp. coracana]|uniref:Cytochrome P450 n=1 Tax=Eleusine coracana subsp. coracana TaxID=191504 RepID=A0AAV5DE31_ELECO|nr:hypothetical protein PR202_ga26128 [Eleusine coracana subsp. coracana]